MPETHPGLKRATQTPHKRQAYSGINHNTRHDCYTLGSGSKSRSWLLRSNVPEQSKKPREFKSPCAVALPGAFVLVA
jgi:hypothetical protein